MFLRHRAKQGDFSGNGFSAVSLFCNLTPKSFKFLTRAKRKKQFQKGVAVLTAGDKPSGIHVLLKGQAQIHLNTGLNKRHTVRLAEPGEIFGLTETISNSPYNVSIETITPCLFEFVPRKDFIRFLHQDAKVCFRLAQSIGFNLQKNYRFLSLR